MIRFLRRWVAPLLILSATFLPAARGQGQAGGAETPAAEKGERTPALQYAVAVLMALGVLVIVCKPSRKG